MKHNKLVLCAGITGFVVFVAGIALGWFGFPVIIRQEITSGVLLKNNSEAFERWRKLPVPIQFKIYVFNVTNPDEVMNGANPIVHEVGPYFYDQYREKYDIQDAGNDTLSYYENSTYFFNKDLSGEDLSEDDVVTVLNVPLLGTALKVQELYSMVLDMMDPVVKAIFIGSDTIFLKARVGDLLWDGLTVIDCTRNVSSNIKSVCKLLPNQLPETIVQVSPGIFQFSLFGHKNNSNTGKYRVNRGISDMNALGHIEEWNDESTISNWLGHTCNMINGTDSTIFPPFRTSKDKLYIFVPDVCRSLNADYVKDVKVEGVPALHYVASKYLLADPKQYAPNMCFCRGDEDDPPENWGCLKEGALDLFNCMGVPVVMTFPHFFNASPDYAKYVEGLKPDAGKHQTFTDLEPNTGIPLRGAKRMQMNMFLTKIPEITVLMNVSEGLFPVVWMEEAHEVDDTVLEKLHNLYIGLTVTTVAKYLVPTIGAVLSAGAAKVVMCGVGKSVCCGCTLKLTCCK